MRSSEIGTGCSFQFYCMSFFLIIALLTGCAPEPKQFDPNRPGPQLLADPDAVSLGAATLMGTDIVFRGTGFQAGEKVIVVLSGSENTNRNIKIPVSYGQAAGNGEFEAEVDKISKIVNILNADYAVGEKGTYVILEDESIPHGSYTATATGYQSDQMAECRFFFKTPSIIDKAKNKIGEILGKIEKE